MYSRAVRQHFHYSYIDDYTCTLATFTDEIQIRYAWEHMHTGALIVIWSLLSLLDQAGSSCQHRNQITTQGSAPLNNLLADRRISQVVRRVLTSGCTTHTCRRPACIRKDAKLFAARWLPWHTGATNVIVENQKTRDRDIEGVLWCFASH